MNQLFLRLRTALLPLLAGVMVLCLAGCSGGTATTEPTTEPLPTETVTDYEVTLELSFGSRSGVYSGTLRGGLPDGSGIFTTQNDAGEMWYYKGDFVNGHFSGEGMEAWANGTSQVGTFENDLLNGYGTLYTADGNIAYEGEWKDGQFEGKGRRYVDATHAYVGTFVDNLPEEKELKERCTEVLYYNCLHNPELYTASPVTIRGEVLRVEERGSDLGYWIAERGNEDLVFFVTYTPREGDAQLEIGRSVQIWGVFSGLRNLTAEEGSDPIVTPSLIGCYAQ